MSDKNITQHLRDNLIPTDPLITLPLWLGLKAYDALKSSNEDKPGKAPAESTQEKKSNQPLPEVEKTLQNELPENPSDVF